MMTLPIPEDPNVLLTPIGVFDTPEAIVRFTIATVPLEMTVVPIPEATQVYVPEPAKQLNVAPAARAAAPGVTEIETTLFAGYVSVHCKAVS